MHKKYLLLLIILLLPLNVKGLEITNDNTGYKVVIEDDANLLSEDEEKKLGDEMYEITNYGNIIFKSTNYNSESQYYYCDDYYRERFGYSSGSIFLIDMANRQIYVYNSGENSYKITSYKSEIITDNIYKYATNGDYYKCASMAYKYIDKLLGGEKIPQPMKYLCNFIFALSSSFLCMYLLVYNKSKITKPSYDELIKGAITRFTINDVSAIQTGTHKVYNPVSDSSSSGGSSGGGGGGGGGSSSGGGHGF